MSKRFKNQQEMDTFLSEPRLAMLMYNGSRPAPTGVPVWFDWDGKTVRMFAGRTSPKVQRLTKDPNISVLVTNRIGEPEGWVAFDGKVAIGDFSADDWSALLDRVAPRYWDLSDPAYAKKIEDWHSVPVAFVSLELVPKVIRSGA
jgi:nitroimidazol reductase NimA-like FMN-containing flavoprotein (pyridoxamine 5'-phosphate oxidase superfamily)